MKVVQLGEVASFQGGSQPAKSNFIYQEKKGFVRFIQIRDFKSEKNLTYIPESKKNRLCKESDILIGRYGASVGQILTGLSGAYNVALIKASPNESLMVSKFFYYFLNSKFFQSPLLNVSKRSAQSGFTKEEISSFLIPLPSIGEQELTVEKLDKAFAEIDSLEKNLKLKEDKTNQLLQSMLSDAFTNTEEFDVKVAKLGEICSFSRGLTYKKSDEVDFSKNIVLRANNIDLNTNSLLLDDLRYIKDSIKIDSEKLVKKNSLIICTASGSKSHLGKVALITEDFGYSFGGFMGQITPSKDCHHRFLLYIFTSPSFKDFLMGLTDGTNINNLKFADIEDYEVQLPKYGDQVKIVTKLDKAFAEIEKLKNQILLEKERISSLRQSILNNAFRFEEKVA
jgi:type I restriction enzyme S subunit